MHVVCTNFCVFFRTVILETVSEIRHHYHNIAHDGHEKAPLPPGVIRSAAAAAAAALYHAAGFEEGRAHNDSLHLTVSPISFKKKHILLCTILQTKVQHFLHVNNY